MPAHIAAPLLAGTFTPAGLPHPQHDAYLNASPLLLPLLMDAVHAASSIALSLLPLPTLATAAFGDAA